jgi:hypothetical protein
LLLLLPLGLFFSPPSCVFLCLCSTEFACLFVRSTHTIVQPIKALVRLVLQVCVFMQFQFYINTGTANAVAPPLPAAAGAPGIRTVMCTQLIKCNRHTTVPQAEAVDQLQANANEKGEQRGYPTIPDHVRHLHCILWLLTNCI